MRFSAAGTPMSLGSRWVPPAPGSRPRVTSGSPSMAWKDTELLSSMNGASRRAEGIHTGTISGAWINQTVRDWGSKKKSTNPHPDTCMIIMNRLMNWLWSERFDNDSPGPARGHHQKRSLRWPPPGACQQTPWIGSWVWGEAPLFLSQTPWYQPLLWQRRQVLADRKAKKHSFQPLGG